MDAGRSLYMGEADGPEEVLCCAITVCDMMGRTWQDGSGLKVMELNYDLHPTATSYSTDAESHRRIIPTATIIA